MEIYGIHVCYAKWMYKIMELKGAEGNCHKHDNLY